MRTREDILDALVPLRKIIRVPDNLSGLIEVARHLRPVVAAFISIAEASQRSQLRQLIDLLDQIDGNASKILQYFPLASRADDKTLKGYYRSHPHYCVFWHTCPIPELTPQYTALLATFLAVQAKLEANREKTTLLQDPAYVVGLSLRQLPDQPEETTLAFLFNLPIEPLPPKGLLTHFESELSKQGIPIHVTGPWHHIGYLHRALTWYATGRWEVSGRKISHHAATHKAGRHGGTEGGAESAPISRNIASGDGTPDIPVTDFVENDYTTRANNKDAEFSPLGDSTRRGSLLTVPARSASAANRGDRKSLARNIARYTGQAISMGNQHLVMTHATLSGHELYLLLRLVDDLDAPEWNETPRTERDRIAAWAACRLFLCRDADEIKEIRTVTGHAPSGDAEFDNNYSAKGILWIAETGQVWLPAASPRHVAPVCNGEPETRTRTTAKGFVIDAPALLSRALLRIKPLRHRLFQCSYEPEFAKALSSINKSRGTALTPERVGHMLAKYMAQLGMHERVYELYFRGMQPNQHNPCVYSAVPVNRLQSLYSEACSRMYQLAGWHEQEEKSHGMTSTPPGEAPVFVGSLHSPTRACVRQTVGSAIKVVRKLASDPGATFVARHNAYTAYLAFFLLATTGLRAVSSLLPARFDIDRSTGLCFVSDKDNDSYEQARLVWLHPELIRQLDAYALHTTRIRQYMALTNPAGIDQLDYQERIAPLSSHTTPNRSKDAALFDNSIPLLFLLTAEAVQCKPTFPTEIQNLLGESWQLRVGALRHFVRSELLLREVPGEVINALLGHGERGEAPWGRFSSLPPLHWRRLISDALGGIIADAGFEILGSPLANGDRPR